MKRQRPAGPPGGRMYTTNFAFQLSGRERLRALLGGEVSCTVRIHVSPGASEIPTQIVKVVSKPRLRWPWKRAAA
jgi:hypothetical protein